MGRNGLITGANRVVVIFVVFGVAANMHLVGCAGNPEPPVNKNEPIGLQLLKVEPALREQRFSTLLPFEDPNDLMFMSLSPTKPVLNRQLTHTGRSSLTLAPGTQRMDVKLASLLMGREFPNGWTLAGGWIRPRAETRLTIAYEHHGKILARNDWQLPANAWTAAMVDVSAIEQVPPNLAATTDVGTLIFEFNPPAPAEVVVDDVSLVDNTRTLVDTTETNDHGWPAWSIKRQGYRTVGEAPQRFNFTLKSPEATPEGWVPEEANALRARFRSGGKRKTLTVYADGRAYWDGALEPMFRDDRFHEQYVAQHASPAQLVVPEEFGKVVRNSQGDANNDGYNELTADYRLAANSARFEMRILPRSPGLVRPIFHIAGLPQGKVMATLEGRLVERTIRLDDGALLIEIPANIERPTTLNLRVQ